MTEKGDLRQADAQGSGPWRSPPPSIGGPVLLWIFITAASLFSVAALLVPSGHRGLRYALAALTLAPTVYGWVLLARSRRPLLPTDLTLPLWGVFAMPNLARPLLQLAQGRPVATLDIIAVLIFTALLVGLLLARRRR